MSMDSCVCANFTNAIYVGLGAGSRELVDLTFHHVDFILCYIKFKIKITYMIGSHLGPLLMLVFNARAKILREKGVLIHTNFKLYIINIM